ncbi:MAG: winged helix-turn-helix transcriptional regulator [Euryarchaeota archaeon]|nr:winged helix-turn-helix transcriptional regulator [Euryarchaeota archaeon]
MIIAETPMEGPLDDEVVAAALSDLYSRKVLAACVKVARPVKEISAATDMPLPTTYRHVNDLVAQGLLVVERSAMTEDGKRYELYRSRIRSARLEFDASGSRVVWEPNGPVEERLARMWASLRDVER